MGTTYAAVGRQLRFQRIMSNCSFLSQAVLHSRAMLCPPGAFNSCKKTVGVYKTAETAKFKMGVASTNYNLQKHRVPTHVNVPWLLALASRVDSTMNTANPSCRFPRCPSVHGSSHEPMCGTICPKLARTARGRTSRSSRRAALRSYRTHSRDKSRQGYLQGKANMRVCIMCRTAETV